MVVTRSQGDAADIEEQRRSRERQEVERRREERQISLERLRRMSQDPPASPQVERTTDMEIMCTPSTSAARIMSGTVTKATAIRREPPRVRSPSRSIRSVRSTASVTTRLRLAELEAAEKMAAIRRKELDMEAELVQKRLALDMSAIQDDAESIHPEQPVETERVNEWLERNPLSSREEIGGSREEPRTLRFDLPRARSPTPPRERSDIERLADTLERMVRPRTRHADLPTFTGAVNEWLPFKAAVRDTTEMYRLSAAENIQRLRSCLKGEARDAVAALLHTATDPSVIMKTLEQCFGRPEVIIDRALDELRKTSKPGSTATDLNSFAVKVQNVICVLRSMDRREYLYNPMLTREVLDKLSPHIRSRWCDYASENEGTADPEIMVLSRFLMREADRALRYTYAPSAGTSHAVKKEVRPIIAVRKKPSTVYAVEERTEEKENCPACGELHVLTQCPSYKALSVEQRWDLIKSKKICFKCAVKTHRRINCKAKPCGVDQCRRPHHSSLHQVEKKPAETEVREKEAVLSVTPSLNTGPRTVLLKMCPVMVAGPRGEVRTHALLDEGATVTLIDEHLAKRIGAEGPIQPLHLNGVNMAQKERASKSVTVKLRGVTKNESHEIRARTIKGLKLHQQTIPASLMELDHLKDLAQDEVCYERARPGILVGSDHWEHIVSRELRVGGRNEPAASRTLLGWVIHGTLPRSVIVEKENVLHVYEQEHEDRRLHEQVEEHFRIESLGVTPEPRVSDADQRAISMLKSSITRIDCGYEVGLPWRRDDIAMPPSYHSALRRLQQIERKMDASTEFAREYTAQVRNLLDKGYAVKCDGSEQTSAVCWYLPHFAVKNPNKPGKQRLVFDAAARSHGVNLNDHLLEGPDLLLSLPGIIFRFREKTVAVTADIQEMFLRIKIRSEDQPAQQFLWRGNDRTNPPQRYKMTSLIFGAASSPFTAHFVRDFNANVHAQRYPGAAEAITRSHYMDDYVASYDTPEEARRIVEELRTVHAAAGFTLRGWNVNDPSVLRDVPPELRSNQPTQLGGEQPESKILGLHWDPERDELGFNTLMNRVPAEVRAQIRAPTKREALSAVMSIYDPLGLLSHYTIRAKIILQNLWRIQMSWDEQIPKEEGDLFAAWLSQLTAVAQLKIPRCYGSMSCERVELHVMCDASEQAYAAVAYWRMSSHKIDVSLVAAKAKVAPRRVQTIPRLELQAAVVGARLADTIKKEHSVEITRTIYWTDSSTVVQWIRNDERRYTPFVSHRLREIAELTGKDEWRWLPTRENVADDATRLRNDAIQEDSRWFMGPDFLRGPEESWPTEQGHCRDEEAEVLHVTENNDGDSWLPDPARFSKHETLVRATARVLAFVDIARRKTTRLEMEHIKRAERLLIQQAQQESFGEDIRKLRASRPVARTSRLFKLDPVLEDGLLRVRGRIGAADAIASTKRPVILDGRHRFTRLLVLRAHCTAGHANRERVTNDLRQRYWVIHLRPTVRAVERDCALCKVRRTKPQPPATGDLPRARLDPFHRPFSNCGVDYFGPMIVKIGRRREKRWGALFTCLTTRAIHIELVATLSTDSAIMALRRMAARRGWPKQMYSDNATNFRGADQELRAAYKEWQPELRDEGLLRRMEWRFIPPGAPNQGGAWERLVRSVKAALNVTLKERTPTEETLRTLLTEAEHSVNARPLTHVSVDPRDPEALTPNHFLLGSSTGLPTTGPCEEIDRRAWRAAQALADMFWRRWVTEYLPTLVPRGESGRNIRPLRVNDVVAIADHQLPRNVWPLGVVLRTFEGPDGGIRVAEVRTKSGVFRRPVSKIVVLHPEEATRATPGGGCWRHDEPTAAAGLKPADNTQSKRTPARTPSERDSGSTPQHDAPPPAAS